MNFYKHFDEVSTSLKNSKIQFMIVGGIAAAFHLGPRPTDDIDLMIDGNNVKQAVEALRPHGYKPSGKTRKINDNMALARFEFEGGGPPVFIDLLLVKSKIFSALWSRREMHPFEKKEIYVIASRDLTAFMEQRRLDRDLADAKQINKLTWMTRAEKILSQLSETFVPPSFEQPQEQGEETGE